MKDEAVRLLERCVFVGSIGIINPSCSICSHSNQVG